MLVKLIKTIPAALASLALLAAACGPAAPVAAPTTAPKPLATAVPAAATAVSGAVSAAAIGPSPQLTMPTCSGPLGVLGEQRTAAIAVAGVAHAAGSRRRTPCCRSAGRPSCRRSTWSPWLIAVSG